MIKKTVKSKAKWLLLISTIAILAILMCGCGKNDNKADYSWTANRTIVHALGVVDGETYTNSREALQNSLEQGQTVFEVDLGMTKDGYLVCAHDVISIIGEDNASYLSGKELYDLTKEEFMSLKIRDKYTPLCMEDLILVMKDNPQMYIVTDTKEDRAEGIKKQFKYIIDLANENDCPEVLDRIIPQIYNDEMFNILKKMYSWKSYIYTSYYTLDPDWDEDVFINSAYEKGIKVVTVFAGRGTDSLIEKANSRGLKVYVHTYNTEEEREEFFERGFWGLYTDSLPPVEQ